MTNNDQCHSGQKCNNMLLTITTKTGVNLCKFSGLPLLRSPFFKKMDFRNFATLRYVFHRESALRSESCGIVLL